MEHVALNTLRTNSILIHLYLFIRILLNFTLFLSTLIFLWFLFFIFVHLVFCCYDAEPLYWICLLIGNFHLFNGNSVVFFCHFRVSLLFLFFFVQAHHVKTDSAVFRLHTNATVILLVTFSIAVTTRQYVGNPIDCVHTR